MEERLQKLLSAAGICSRRTAEEYICAGRVRVNGEIAALGQRADPDQDEILVDGVPLSTDIARVYVLLNKPRGYVTTLRDERGRPTVADLVRGVGTRVYPVGRLDLDSEGLLLMTNDGILMHRLIHPSHEVSKTYRVWVRGDLRDVPARLARVRDLDGEQIRPAQVELVDRSGDTAELSVTIHEGKTRQIRRMCAQCGLEVRRLQRVREHSLELGDLPCGQWRYLQEEEVAALKKP